VCSCGYVSPGHVFRPFGRDRECARASLDRRIAINRGHFVQAFWRSL
jgi:hypothetical protein